MSLEMEVDMEVDDTAGSSGNTLLHHIVGQRPINEYLQLKAIRRVIRYGADLSQLNEENNPPLHHAVANYAGQLKAMKYLFKKGADQIPLNGDEKTLLQVVNYSKPSYKLVKFLFKMGCTIDVVRAPFPLQKAVESENCSFKSVRLLIEKGARASSAALMKALQNPTTKIKIIGLLLASGAYVNACDNFDYTPLHYAISNSNLNPTIVHLLLFAGADCTLKTKGRNFTALHLMARRRQPNHYKSMITTAMLLGYGSDVDAICNKKRTPLMYASKKHDSFEIVKSLLMAGAQPDKKDVDGLDALHHAVRSISPNGKIIRELIAGGSNISSEVGGLTAYEYFLDGPPERFNASVFEAFFEFGVDVNFKNSNNQSALSILLEQCPDNLDTIIFLLDNRAWCTDDELEWQLAIDYIADNCGKTYSKDLETIIKCAVLHQFYKRGPYFVLRIPSEYVAIKSQCIHECFKMLSNVFPHGNLLHMLCARKICYCGTCINAILTHLAYNIGMVYFDTLLQMIKRKFLLECLEQQSVYTMRNNQIIRLNRDCIHLLGKYMDKTHLFMSILAFSAFEKCKD